MRKIFVTYGDLKYRDQVERIMREAEETGEFDSVTSYNQEYPFPEGVKFYIDKFEKGGGFRLWKPIILMDLYSKLENGDVIVYADAGSTLTRHKGWSRYFNLLSKYDMLLFKDRGRIGDWCSRKVATAITQDSHTGKRADKGPKWFKKRSVISNVLFIKKSNALTLLNLWAEMAALHPTLFADNSKQQDMMESERFREHRHDQAVLNGLMQTLPKNEKKLIKILPNRFENIYKWGQPIMLSRICPALGQENRMKRKNIFSSLRIHLFG